MSKLMFSITGIVILLATACNKQDPSVPLVEYPTGKLELLGSYALEVTEPSGLSFGPNNATLLTVSDNTNKVYEIDLKGKLIRTLNYSGKDLEGVTYNSDEGIVAVVEEADREVTLINYTTGNKIQTYKINIPFGAKNSGLEGISYNTNNKMYYIVNETNPDLMILWNPVSGILSQEKLSFATDYSGIFIDARQSLLWIVSDQSKSVYKCDYATKVLMEYKLDILKYEGICISNDILYLVNDATAHLYVYKIKNN